MYLFDLNQLAKFEGKGLDVQIVAQSGHARYVLFSIEAGKGLREHTTSSQIAVQLISGQASFAIQGEERTLNPGQLLLLEADVPHTVQAVTDAVMLLTMTPDPSHHSLAKELFDKIKPMAQLS